MLLVDLGRQVQRRFGDGIGAVITNQDILDWVNEGSNEIAKFSKVNFIEHTSTISAYLAAGFLAIPSAIEIEYIKVDNSFIEPKDYRLFQSTVGGRLDQTGRPQYYYLEELGQDDTDPAAIRDTVVKLFPTPDTSFNNLSIAVGLNTLCTKLTLTNLTEAIDLPPVYHSDLMNFCLMRAHERMKDWQGQSVAQTAYQQGLSRRVDISGEVEDSFPVMQDVIGY